MEWILAVVIFVLDLIAIVSVLTSGTRAAHKLLWVLLILLLPVIGMALYFLIGRRAPVGASV